MEKRTTADPVPFPSKFVRNIFDLHQSLFSLCFFEKLVKYMSLSMEVTRDGVMNI